MYISSFLNPFSYFIFFFILNNYFILKNEIELKINCINKEIEVNQDG